MSFLINSHGAGGLGLGLLDDGATLVGGDFNVGSYSMSAKEDMVLDFLRTIQTLAPGRILPSFRVRLWIFFCLSQRAPFDPCTYMNV